VELYLPFHSGYYSIKFDRPAGTCRFHQDSATSHADDPGSNASGPISGRWPHDTSCPRLLQVGVCTAVTPQSESQREPPRSDYRGPNLKAPEARESAAFFSVLQLFLRCARQRQIDIRLRVVVLCPPRVEKGRSSPDCWLKKRWCIRDDPGEQLPPGCAAILINTDVSQRAHDSDSDARRLRRRVHPAMLAAYLPPLATGIGMPQPGKAEAA
jgi:hypothetical protein